MLAVAAGVVFMAFLAVFPPSPRRWFLCMDYLQVLPRSAINSHFSPEFPAGRRWEILREADRPPDKPGKAAQSLGIWLYLSGLPSPLWSANAGMKAHHGREVNVVYEEK